MVYIKLAEYAVILKIIQSEKRRDAKSRRAFLKVRHFCLIFLIQFVISKKNLLSQRNYKASL